MTPDLAGKVAVVTGGASGIGAALCRAIRAAGGEAIAADIAGEGVVHCDVTRPEALESLADEVWARFGRVDLLVNNAGIGSGGKRLADTPLDSARQTFEVNFWGVWHGCRAFAPRLAAQDHDSAIYNVASENALFCAIKRAAAYVASKHAVLGLTESLRTDLPPHVHAGTIIPGWVDTPIGSEAMRGHAMDADRFAAIILPQLLARERFVVSHAYNAVRMHERVAAIDDAFARNAPRYDGDEEFDVERFIDKMRAARGAV